MADETIVPETQNAVPSVEATPEVAKPAKRKTRQRCSYVLLREIVLPALPESGVTYEAAGCAKTYRQALKQLTVAAPGQYSIACFRSKHTVSQKTVNVVE